jgi:predicted lactoylglutathione lyase
VTLDFKAWELTKFQEPSDLFVYVDGNDFADYLKESGFSEGTRGHVVLLPISKNIENEIEQVYFDSIAKGGRAVLDAIALELLYPDKIRHKGQFPVEYVTKVQEEMTRLPIEASS